MVKRLILSDYDQLTLVDGLLNLQLSINKTH